MGDKTSSAKPPLGVRSALDSSGRRTYTEWRFVKGLIALVWGGALLVGCIGGLSEEGFGIGLDRRIIMWLFGAVGAALTCYGVVLLVRRHTVTFHPDTKTVVSKVSGLGHPKERAYRYGRVRLLVLPCHIWGWHPWAFEPKMWALAIELGESYLVLALDRKLERVERAGEELSREVGLHWSRSGWKLSRFLF